MPHTCTMVSDQMMCFAFWYLTAIAGPLNTSAMTSTVILRVSE